MDLSDRTAEICVLDLNGGEPIRRETLELEPDAVRAYFAAEPVSRVVMEAGTHSPWLSRLIEELGHEVRVGDPRRLKLVTENVQKSDIVDAELLGRLGRVEDLELIRTVSHRPEQMQADYVFATARDLLVKIRTMLVNYARGVVKTMGGRLPSSSTASFARNEAVIEAIPELLRPALQGVMAGIAHISRLIADYDKAIERLLQKRYAEESAILQQVPGVGPITALCFICVIQSPGRFESSRSVGAYVGLAPGRKQSGKSDPKRGITKSGDALLRCQLTRAAHYILTFGEDSGLKRVGQRILAKDRPRHVAACAVARKLGVLLHRLWATRATYDPNYRTNRRLITVN
jgi:transposase